MIKKEVAVEELRVGMYVVDLDRPWIGTPFDFQGFPLTSEEQIESLKAYCKVVFVDPEREQWTPPPRRAADTHGGPRVGRLYRSHAGREGSHRREGDLQPPAKEAIRHSLDNLRLEGEIESEKLTGRRHQHDRKHPAQPRRDDAAQYAAAERQLRARPRDGYLDPDDHLRALPAVPEGPARSAGPRRHAARRRQDQAPRLRAQEKGFAEPRKSTSWSRRT